MIGEVSSGENLAGSFEMGGNRTSCRLTGGRVVEAIGALAGQTGLGVRDARTALPAARLAVRVHEVIEVAALARA